MRSVPAKLKSNGDPGLWVHRRSQRVRFELEVERQSWPLGSPAKSKGAIRTRGQTTILASGFAGEVKGCNSNSKSNVDPGLWVRQRSQWVRFEVKVKWRSRTTIWVRGAKSLGRRRSRSSWVAGNGLSLSLSLSLRASAISLAHSLPLSVFQKMVFEGKIKTEINSHHKHVRTEKHFQKMHFPCTTKHPHLWKSISGNHFQPIQTQP